MFPPSVERQGFSLQAAIDTKQKRRMEKNRWRFYITLQVDGLTFTDI
jgi:hypothetical protein